MYKKLSHSVSDCLQQNEKLLGEEDLFCIAFQAKLGRWDSHTPELHPRLLTLRSWRLPDAPVRQQWPFSTQRRRGFRDSLLGVLRASCGYTMDFFPDPRRLLHSFTRSARGVFLTLLSPQPYDIPTVWDGEKLTPVSPHVR